MKRFKEVLNFIDAVSAMNLRDGVTQIGDIGEFDLARRGNDLEFFAPIFEHWTQQIRQFYVESEPNPEGNIPVS